MNLYVESTTGPHGDPEPFAFMLGESRLDVVHIVDRWFGEDYCYFKLLASDDATYILRFDTPSRHWNLTLYQAASVSRTPK